MVWRRLSEMAGIRHRSDKLLKEQDDLFGGGDDEEAEDEEGGDEEGDDDMFGDPDEEEGDDEAEEEEEEPAEELSPDELAEFGPGEIDQELDRIMSQIFDDSMKSAQAKSQQSAGYPGAETEDLEESLNDRSLRILLEDEGDDIVAANAEDFDMGRFCQEIARYIQHYDTLIDMEGMIFNKAKQFILNNFNQETADLYQEKMALDHDVDFAGDFVQDYERPIAVGAGGEGGGGGGA